MKTIITIIITAVLLVMILRSNVTPWRLVGAADLERQSQPPQTIERRVIVPAAATVDHSGDWMHDPNYRTGLEKTTVSGRPEDAISRDRSKPAPTPIKP